MVTTMTVEDFCLMVGDREAQLFLARRQQVRLEQQVVEAQQADAAQKAEIARLCQELSLARAQLAACQTEAASAAPTVAHRARRRA